MLRIIHFLILCAILITACKSEKKTETTTAVVETPKIPTHKLVQKWESDTLFKVPESVLFDAKNQVLYVSNIDGKEPWGADGKGSIGKLGLDGKIIQVEWVTGLHAPKGMGIFENKLYVADMKQVIVIDIASGKIVQKISVPGAGGLNDISIDASGVIYVTDSQGKRLYKIETNNASMVLDSLSGPNGVLVRGRDLFITNSGGLYKVDPISKSIAKVIDGMEGGTDGVEHVKDEDFIVSCWAGTVWYINGDGRKEMIFDGASLGKNTADIGWDPASKTVYVPTFWKNAVIAFEVVEELK